jgi:hypothetical protein
MPMISPRRRRLEPVEYQIREWDAHGGQIRELAVCRDAAAAHGAFDAAAFSSPESFLTMGQNARILRSHGPAQGREKDGHKLLEGPASQRD